MFIGTPDSGNKVVKKPQHLYSHKAVWKMAGERSALSLDQMSAGTDNSFEKIR